MILNSSVKPYVLTQLFLAPSESERTLSKPEHHHETSYTSPDTTDRLTMGGRKRGAIVNEMCMYILHCFYLRSRIYQSFYYKQSMGRSVAVLD